MEYRDYYKTLGVTKNSDENEIKRAYRRLARQYHPDKNPGDKAAEEKFKEINEAYEVLGNPDNRAKYDQLGHNYHRFQQMGGNPQDFDFSQWFNDGAGGQRVNVDFGDLFGNGGMSDFFSTIFGSQSRTARRSGTAFQRGGSRDTEQTVEITLEEAYQGTSRTFSQNGQQFTARIPAGAKTGTKVRLRGKGNPSPSGAGDLFLVVKVLPHKVFKRDGHTLQVNVEVGVLTAVLGGKVTIPTMDGSVSLTIPAGTQGGQTFRLRGKGMPHLRHKDKFGDLMAKIKIRIPQKLTDQERALYEQLSKLHPEA